MSLSIHSDDRVALSVVTATWNNARRLRVTLEALTACSMPAGIPWELVLVANNCGDDTASVARSFGDRLPIVYLEESPQGLSHARNTGVRAARGSLIVFTDDDVTLPGVDDRVLARVHRAAGRLLFRRSPDTGVRGWAAGPGARAVRLVAGDGSRLRRRAATAPRRRAVPRGHLGLSRRRATMRGPVRSTPGARRFAGTAPRRRGLGRHGSATGCRRHALVSADVGRRPFRPVAQVLGLRAA